MIVAEQLNCRELVELVTAYLEEALTPAERLRFDRHIEACGKCAEYLRQIRRTVQIVGTLRPDDLSQEAEAALLEAFRGWRRGA